MLTRALRTDTDYIPIQDHQLDDIYDNMTYEQQLRAAIRISKQEERQRQGQVASDETAQPDTNAPAPSQQARPDAHPAQQSVSGVENDHDAALASSSSPVVAAASSSPKDNVTSNGRRSVTVVSRTAG